MGATAGLVLTGAKVLLMKTDAGATGPLPYVPAAFKQKVPIGDIASGFADRLTANVVDYERAYPMIGGALLTASPRIPGIRMIAGPVNRAIKKATKGKVSL